MQHYYVNNEETRNPGLHHEVHTEEHANELRILSKTYLEAFSNCMDAVIKARRIYSDADGCKICCTQCQQEQEMLLGCY